MKKKYILGVVLSIWLGFDKFNLIKLRFSHEKTFGAVERSFWMDSTNPWKAASFQVSGSLSSSHASIALLWSNAGVVVVSGLVTVWAVNDGVLLEVGEDAELFKTKRNDGRSISMHVADVGGGESVGVGVQKAGCVEIVNVGLEVDKVRVGAHDRFFKNLIY